MESCVHLSCPKENNVPCEINVKLDSKLKYTITHIDIVSEVSGIVK